MKKIQLIMMFFVTVSLVSVAPFQILADDKTHVVIGSKKFTESVILGEVLSGLIKAEGKSAHHRRELGGTRMVWSALIKGDIDAYVEYTGTLTQEILANLNIKRSKDIKQALAGYGIAITKPLGFNNTYAIGVHRDIARKRNIKTISDFAKHADLPVGFSNEFMDRRDGWQGLKRHYKLPHKNVRGLDHDLAYRGIKMGDLAATDVYTTDADIAYYDLVVLQDDRHYFPAYEAVVIYRKGLKKRLPNVVARFHSLEGKFNAASMRALNSAVKLKKLPENAVASNFIQATFQETNKSQQSSRWTRLQQTTLDHLFLVAISLGVAIIVAVPLGIVAALNAALGQIILSLTGLIQTIPTLALFVFMIPLLGIGGPPAVVALFLYSLLPIVRNTHAGLTGIPLSIRESAEALGLPANARLRLIELPLAARSILAGIKTSAVINVGTATLGALIGAGGYGQPILTGIRLDDMGLILEGAIPAALLALFVQGVFELAERWVVPRGLRLKPIR